MQEDLQRLSQLLGNTAIGQDMPGEIRKSLTTGLGWAGVNLEEAVKLMLPLYAGLRAWLPVDTPTRGGATANYKLMLGPGSWNKSTAMGTAAGAVGQAVVSSTIEIDASYCTQAVQAEVQWEAIPQAKAFSDPLQDEMCISLTDLLQLEELTLLYGNNAVIANPVPAFSNVGSGSYTPPAKVWVTAITGQGALANKTVDALVASNIKLGETIGATGCSPTQSTCLKCQVSWPAIPGALGYKVYMGAAFATATLVDPNAMFYPSTSTTAMGDPIVVTGGQSYVTVTKIELNATSGSSSGTVGSYANVGAGGDTNHYHPTADGTAQANVFEGCLAMAQKHTIYGQDIGTYQGTYDCQGSKLTTKGSGITEFDNILGPMWQTWHIGPQLIIGSTNTVASITDQLVAANSAALFRLDVTNERGGFTGGLYVGGYLNKFAASMVPAQNAVVPIWAHPYMEDGTVIMLTRNVPYTYSKERRGFAIDCQTPYTYFELARSTRTFPYSNFYTETLKCYHPPAQATIVGARVA